VIPVSLTLSTPLDPALDTEPVTRLERRARTEGLLRELAGTDDERRRHDLHDEIVRLNLDVVESVVSRFRNRGVPEEDLTQVACLGLVKAVHRFDPDAGSAFLSFAVPTMRGEVRRYFRDLGWTVRPPRAIQELQAAIGRAAQELSQELARPPRPAEIAAHLEEDLDDVVEAMAAQGCFAPASLDVSPGDGSGPSLGDLLGTEDLDVLAVDARVVLAPAVRQLGEREQRILYLRFFEGLTQREIGEELGVTQMQISRILARIMVRLRDSILADETLSV
jgi:RNA polymerase sigma-B factor